VQSTGLVRHVFRLLQGAIKDERAVPWLVLENVEALLDRQTEEPPAVHYIVAALEALGYDSWAHRVICSAAFGVPNRRKRVFIVASWSGDARDVLLSQACPQDSVFSAKLSSFPCICCAPALEWRQTADGPAGSCIRRRQSHRAYAV
jgi:site-specific DNA-cytosine methylase